MALDGLLSWGGTTYSSARKVVKLGEVSRAPRPAVLVAVQNAGP
eukprot:CAMPEP_0172562646 /NCGR_PEP_ID=MMETSP1067-20121228/97746_1 /TAXON_ID=265564 ORGANISM="Thalassiosira punctigera, Strain Tpunct2005C2" /NCGR_SAMPLE_ID=MMETSP1067 /ASSEMBLY_ACC=CAM_ASM_000444 /LENGTH=43 /DNA_ID= /DNA_START= /DNA_END= /DNA_ORIENTATION=